MRILEEAGEAPAGPAAFYNSVQGGDEVPEGSWLPIGDCKGCAVNGVRDFLGTDLALELFVEREQSFLLWNGFFVSFIIVLVNSVALVGVNIDDVSSRLSITLSLLLAQIAQQTFVAQVCVSANYFTLMDKHFIASLCILMSSVVEVGIVRKFAALGKVSSAEVIDAGFHSISTVCWILAHGLAFFMSHRLRPSWKSLDQGYDIHWQDIGLKL